eukprot:SAG22_NODE_1291_length_4852_cov_3.176310_4_plen_69_part_00
MIPLTTSLYVPGQVGDISQVLVDVGTGYYIEVTARAFIPFVVALPTPANVPFMAGVRAGNNSLGAGRD